MKFFTLFTTNPSMQVILISRRSLRDGAMLRTEARQETRQLLPLRHTRTSKKDRLVRLKTRQAAPAALDLVAHICMEALNEAHQESVHLKAQVAHQPAWEAHVVHMSWLVLLYV